MEIGVGVIGSGFMGRTWSEVAARHAQGTRLAAVWGGTRAAGLASDYGVPLESSFEAVLGRPDVDLVVLASPPAVHRAQTLAAAAAGKHLLVEKPMAQDVRECEAMVGACRTAGVRLSVVSHHRFRDAPVAAHQVIQSGRIGAVRMIRVTGTELGWWDMSKTKDEWKLDPAQQTAWASWAAHSCDILRWLTGSEARLAFGQITNFSGVPPRVGQSAMAEFTFRSGVLAHVWMTYETPAPGLSASWNMLIMGSDGLIDLDPYGACRVGTAAGWETVFEQAPFDAHDPVAPLRLRAYARQLEDVVDAIATGGDPYVSGVDGMHTVAMIEAVERSAAGDQATPIPW